MYIQKQKKYIYTEVIRKSFKKDLWTLIFFPVKRRYFYQHLKQICFHILFSQTRFFFVLIVYKYMSLNVTDMSNLVHDNSELKTPANGSPFSIIFSAYFF